MLVVFVRFSTRDPENLQARISVLGTGVRQNVEKIHSNKKNKTIVQELWASTTEHETVNKQSPKFFNTSVKKKLTFWKFFQRPWNCWGRTPLDF